MDHQPHSEPEEGTSSVPVDREFVSESMINDSGAGGYAGAFFPSSQHLVISGGVFTSNNHIYPSADPPSDFRRIPVGDIDLWKEVRLTDESGIVGPRRSQGAARRIYSAKINGQKSNMTVALYQGDTAEEDWTRDISTYTWLRHPNLVQIFATASSRGVYATVLHDDLTPLDQFLDIHRHSPMLTVYIWAFCEIEWEEAMGYLWSNFQWAPLSEDCTFWIRCSSGRLCLDNVLDGGSHKYPDYTFYLPRHNLVSLNHPIEEATIISSLTLEQYHSMCSLHLARKLSHSFSAIETVKCSSVISLSASTQLEKPVEIAFIPLDLGKRLHDYPWYFGGPRAERVLMADGWTRYKSIDIMDGTFEKALYSHHDIPNYWPGQANYFLSRMQTTSGYEDYVMVEHISFEINLSPASQIPPEGYLFLCPGESFKSGPNSYRWPECAAYWSLNPLGREHRISTEEAQRLGFPSTTFATRIHGLSWDAGVYAGLRQFHQGKGFDPDSQDVARRLGYSLYQLTEEPELPFAHVEEESADSGGEQVYESSNNAKPKESAPSPELKENCTVDTPTPDIPSTEAASSIADKTPTILVSDAADMIPPSQCSRIMMELQFGLILTLALFLLYDWLRVH